jgi:hypothetical protein
LFRRRILARQTAPLSPKENAMRAYGVKRNDRGCCPGHDKFPSETYRSRRSKRARAEARRIAHKRARAWARVELLTLRP